MQRLGLIALSAAFVTLWSSGWTASHFAVSNSSALSVLAMRYIVMFVALLLIVTIMHHWQRVQLKDVICHLIIGALCHAIYLLGSISAFELGVSAAVVAFISSLQPLVTALLAGSVTGECIQARHCKGVFLGLLSTVLIVSESYNSGVTAFALALPLIAMIAISTGTVLNRRQELIRQHLDSRPLPIPLIMLMHSIGALIVLVPLAATQGQLQWQFSTSEWSAILWLALVVSLCAYALLLILLRHLSAIRVSSFTYLVPPMTMLQSYLVFGNTFSISDCAAFGLAVAAVYIIMTNSKKSETYKRVNSNSAFVAHRRLMTIRKSSSALDIEL